MVTNVVNINNQSDTQSIVTIHELVVAREYYRFIDMDLDFVVAITSLLTCGKGYTREVEDPETLSKIRSADRQKVMDIK